MNTTIEALQGLYVAMGGALTDTHEDIADGAPVSDYVVIPDMIAAIATVAGGGGAAGLPAVDAADNGKVLKVVNGAWSVAGVVATDTN